MSTQHQQQQQQQESPPILQPPTPAASAAVTTDGIGGTTAVASVPSSSSSSSNPQQQMVKALRDANNKYKSLLKLAKERIQSQEEEIEALKIQLSSINKQLQEFSLQSNRNNNLYKDTQINGEREEEEEEDASWSTSHHHQLLRVCQRIRVDNDDDTGINTTSTTTDGSPTEEDGRYTIWALLEYENQPPEDSTANPNSSSSSTNKRWRKWKKFTSESELSDFIFRDTGEPIILPQYSLTPDQSWKVEQEAKNTVAHITEEFRRYRVRAEVQRKQADATIKALQGATLHTVQQKIEGWQQQQQTIATFTTDTSSTTTTNMIQWKKEWKEQEAQWREAYDSLLQENNILKSAGGEALLASQWRHRFEACEKEKQEYSNKVEAMEQQLREISANNKYESKYRDLKESFRLYRKKAKEIFEAQQQGGQADYLLTSPSVGGGAYNGGEDAKIAYLRNLMVNYLCSDVSMRDPMEVAIKTVLQFTPEDIARIEKAKKANEAWF